MIVLGLISVIGCATTVRQSPSAPDNTQLYTIMPTPSAMPQIIKNNIKKIAIIPHKADSPSDKEWQSSIEEVFSVLPRLKPSIKLLERDKIKSILSELQIQMSGLVADNEAVHVGRMLGADHIVLYEFNTASDNDIRKMQFRGGSFVSTVRVKIIDVETSEVVFDHTSKTLSILHFSQNSGVLLTPLLPEMTRRVSMEYCSYVSSAALNAAFNPSNIGIIFDISYQGQGAKVAWPFTYSIAARSGIKAGDIILQINGRKLTSLQEAIELSYTSPPQGTIVIEREGKINTVAYQ